ncbi:thiamine/thiamine pyrophosphate ABC transporter, permease protein [Mesorhizobium sp. M4B.F.Ca.ET.215.01.1.1]|uniref:Thiamine transport system permease protein ThiP n=2 Tax=Mesorhizobium TaxID=68287 RepID=A0ABU5AKI5_9HYPH|nr:MULTISPECIES: thiamine/thiamine pyrophosphate ABC transporter permease [Mesorhizobium]MDX8537737.1 thiamine/thiamine pyrophosphate ABC transporter permease [Mesorhizobium abyssinicae]RVD38988.1 thiamine/thiamine pyrophosphate ABC transporter, permease protein [Mesorhizobium sp. M4B.F.Ca.ET.019.03.1.1]RWF61431.1 MAG: thiamine/thiamine pyrophosphate ABC transporter, permease protein [Mesorhizobium sp.]TGQ07090.1 thiamine/thiamine pyrophosphate ABC transporter, permease protein [Mesorhizobium s
MQLAPRSDPRITAGIAALGAITLLIGGAFAGLVIEGAHDFSGAASAFDPYLLRVVRFTLWQALLSTLLSVVPALFVARALARHPRFPGRGLILQLFALPLALPAIVAALGILALYGSAGYFAGLLGGRDWPGIYGLSGILVAHVFFNLPLATRLFLEALGTVPANHWRLASQLGMGVRHAFRLIEWPALRAALPGVAGLVFMLCITSFTIVLTLGGGPAATTLEVAIYQALRFDFDPARAVTLTLLQIALTFAVVLALTRLGANTAGDANLPVAARRYLSASPTETLLNAALIVLALLFVAGPMAATVAAGLGADLGRLAGEGAVRQATLTSVVLAFLSASLAVTMSLALIAARRALALKRRAGRKTLLEHAADTGAGFVLVVPPIVVGAGWFLLLRTVSDVFAIAPLMVVTVNAVMAMPFAIRAIRPAYDAASERHERLCLLLGISGWNRLSLIDWPSLRRPLATGFAFAMALSLGDLGVIALFGSDSVQTLPYLLLARMGSYRTADAAGLALLLGLVCLALVLAADRLGRGERS